MKIKNRKTKRINDYIKKLDSILIDESNDTSLYEGKISDVEMDLTKKVAESIKTDRCSIWLYNEDNSSIICQQLYIRSEDKWYQGVELFEKDYFSYFQALNKNPIIIASDAENHPSTSCFRDTYLKPLGIKSMLDVPLVYNKKTIGVICIESLEKRDWMEVEVNFARLLSSFYSFSYSIKIVNKQKKQMEDLYNFIDESAIVTKADKHGKITYVNQKFIDISGYTAEESIGQDHKVVNSGHHPKKFWMEMYSKVVKEKKIWHDVCVNKRKDGELYYVDTFIKGDFDEAGNFLGYMSIRQDITGLKRSEQGIQNRMNAINRSNAVVEFDLDGKIVFVNGLFLETLGYGSESELVGKHHSVFIESDYQKTEEYKEFWRSLKLGNFYSGVVTRIKKDGTIVYLQATYNPILKVDGSPFRVMKIATDITERVRQRQEIEKKNTYLEHAAKILRHDMHSGINTYIPRGISSLERRLKQEDIENLKLEAPLKLIKEGLKHTQKVYKGVYEFTNLVKKDACLSKDVCNIKEILSDYLSTTSYKSQVQLDDNLPTINVNESLFCTAIDNLIRNGLKYNDSTIKLVKVYSEEGKIIIEDNGRGIDQKEFEYLSRPYVRKEGQKETGSGLGLNICISILKEHGFEIKAEKLVQGGTKLKIKVN